jgi:hypothetical protein
MTPRTRATYAMIPRPTEKYESGGRSARYEMIAETAFIDAEHRNRSLFCVACAHHLLHHFNDLAEE